MRTVDVMSSAARCFIKSGAGAFDRGRLDADDNYYTSRLVYLLCAQKRHKSSARERGNERWAAGEKNRRRKGEVACVYMCAERRQSASHQARRQQNEHLRKRKQFRAFPLQHCVCWLFFLWLSFLSAFRWSLFILIFCSPPKNICVSAWP